PEACPPVTGEASHALRSRGTGLLFGVCVRLYGLPHLLRTHWALFLLMLVAVPLIFYNLAYEPYWQDELTSFDAAKGILAHGYPSLISGFIYPKGELYSYCLALFMRIFGDQAGIPRALSAVEYIASLPLLYVVGCYFFDRRVALLATAMLALSPIALVWGRQVRMYEQAQVLTLVVFYLFYRATQEPGSVRIAYLAVACLVVDYLSHEEVFITLPALLIGVLLFSRDGRHRLPAVLYNKHWWFAAALGASLIAIQLVVVKFSHPPVLGTDGSEQPFIQVNAENIPFYIGLLFFPIDKEPVLVLNSILALCGCLGAIHSTDRRVKYCALFLVVSFLTLMLIFTMRADRYFYPLLPAYYLLGAYALLRGLRAIWTFALARVTCQQPGPLASPAPGGYLPLSMRLAATWTALLFCACVVFCPLLPVGGYSLSISRLAGFSYHRHYVDSDNAGQYVKAHLRRGDIVISITPDYMVYHYIGQADYFFSIDRALFLFERDGHIVDTSIGGIALLRQEDLQAILASHPRVWLISDSHYQIDVLKRFTFPADLHIVYEGYNSIVYLRGSA
nr:glycosyltransferase family 39 protein [Ktedonobacteraceae bacterium]